MNALVTTPNSKKERFEVGRLELGRFGKNKDKKWEEEGRGGKYKGKQNHKLKGKRGDLICLFGKVGLFHQSPLGGSALSTLN